VAANRYAVVTVADTGTGIAPENLEEIAEPFYTTKPAGEGTGLGLATVNGIVAAHGGTVTIRSTLGRGTAVELVFPAIDLPGTDDEARSGLAGQHEAELGAPQPSTPPTRDLSTGSGTILVIDDDGAIADLLADLLDRLGVDAIGCNDPTTAIDTIREAPNAWRAIVVDMIMPRMTGLELIADLRQRGIDVPAVLISGQPPEVDRDTLAALNIAAFAQQPIRTPDLRRLFGGRDPA
jgi:CheY-like chemotaxis protein